jgi:hypothetical protein
VSNDMGRRCTNAEIVAWNEEAFAGTEGVIFAFATGLIRGATVGYGIFPGARW